MATQGGKHGSCEVTGESGAGHCAPHSPHRTELPVDHDGDAWQSRGTLEASDVQLKYFGCLSEFCQQGAVKEVRA